MCIYREKKSISMECPITMAGYSAQVSWRESEHPSIWSVIAFYDEKVMVFALPPWNKPYSALLMAEGVNRGGFA